MDGFAALGDLTRREIVTLLAKRDRCAGDIAAGFDMSAPAISQHLRVLRESSLVAVEKRGRERIYSLDPTGLVALEAWVNETRDLWNARLDRLQKLLEGETKNA